MNYQDFENENSNVKMIVSFILYAFYEREDLGGRVCKNYDAVMFKK